MKNYYKANVGAGVISTSAIKITVDGVVTDGTERAFTFVKDSAEPVRVMLSLPTRQYTLRRISRV